MNLRFPISVHLVVGARPNFVKIASLYKALREKSEFFQPRIIHTGQHYDTNMSEMFFRDFGLPEPDVNLGVGSGSHAQQTAKIMTEYERVCLEESPQLVVVVGDVNSTVACALVAKKMQISVAHLEAGLRSNDRTMPEEINRLVTDAIADVLWTPSPDADENLLHEGIPEERIRFVGNVMIDALVLCWDRVSGRKKYLDFDLKEKEYGLLTLHRPSNVDTPERLESILRTVMQSAERLPILFLLHPRTRARLKNTALFQELESHGHVRLSEPQGYIDFMSLLSAARFALTDSGGLQEETTYLNIPCLTLRENTERPITVTQGTNELIGVSRLLEGLNRVLDGDWKEAVRPHLWDGKTSDRIVEHLRELAGKTASRQ